MAHEDVSSPRDLETSVSPAQARPLQLIYGATAFAVIVFFALLLVLASSGASDSYPARHQSMWAAVLSIAHFIFAVGVYGVVPMLFRRISTSESSQGGAHRNSLLPLERPNAAVPRLHKALIVRLTMMESVALFGLTVCLIANSTGMLKTEPLYWLNLTTGAVFMGFVSATFPTAERLTQVLQSVVFGSSG